MNEQTTAARVRPVLHSELMAAAQSGDLAVLERYIAQGSEPDLASDVEGETALMCAAGYGQLQFVQRLLDAGVAQDRQNKFLGSALHYAVLWAHSPVLRVLLAHAGAPGAIDLTDNHGHTALHCAATACNADMVVQLLDAGAAGKQRAVQEMVTQAGWRKEAVATLRAFTEREPDVLAFMTAFSHARGSLLHLAAGYGSAELVNFMLDHGAPVDLTNPDDNEQATPFHLACEFGNTDAIRTLAARGADTGRLRGSDLPALVLACKSAPAASLDGAVRALLELGHDPNQPGRFGETACDVARDKQLEDVLSLFDVDAARRAMEAVIRAPGPRRGGPASINR